ncbi:MAG: tetratricopeptide repeat protein [Anaerohalosphaeraceae bacterium]
MSKLLEIFGKAITVDTAELIWHWLMTIRTQHQPAPPPWQAELDGVLEQLGRRDYRTAEEALKRYLSEVPDCLFGRITAASVCLYRNDLPGAYEQLQSVYLRQPSNTMALYAMGYCRERMGQLSEALEFYQDCIKFKSHLQLPRLRMAAIYFQSGRLDKTIREYEMLTTEHPEDISAHVLLGNLYLLDGRAEQAVDTFNMAILSHPDNFRQDSPNEEIQRMLENGLFEEAVENILGLMEQTGPQPDLYLHLADIYSRNDNPSEAIVHYEQALRLQPNYLEAAIKLGTQYLRNRQYTPAAEQFNQAAEINDEIVDAYMGLCRAQYAAGQTDEAEQTLALGAAIQQNSGLLYSETALLYFQAALDAHRILHQDIEKTTIQMEDVLEAHKRQIARRIHCADVYYKYGILLMGGARYEEAIEQFQKALSINSTHYRARTKLAMCLFETGRTEEALHEITSEPPLEQNLLQLHYRTAVLFCDQKQFTRAMRHLKAVFQQEDASDLYQNIELVLENLGLIDRTLSTWKQLSEMSENILPQPAGSKE